MTYDIQQILSPSSCDPNLDGFGGPLGELLLEQAVCGLNTGFVQLLSKFRILTSSTLPEAIFSVLFQDVFEDLSFSTDPNPNVHKYLVP